MKRLLRFFTACLLVSCGGKKNTDNSVYFAGEIVNPSSDYVVLYKNDQPVDSAKLDDNNLFAFSLPNVEEGLHHFVHDPQYQYVYLEKGDSLLIRLNASATYFDESLVFSGDNEEVNNFMIDMFLTHEDEESLIYSYFKLPPEDFSKKLDSLRDQKLEELNAMGEEGTVSDTGFKMAKASIDYSTYLYKEKYPFYHKKKTGVDLMKVLDSSFYSYRNNLDLNESDLTYFRPYYNYIKYHFSNLSYLKCEQNCGEKELSPNQAHLHYNGHKLHLIDSLVRKEELRNNLFRNVAMDYLLKVHESTAECDKFLKKFEMLCNNREHIQEIKSLYTGIQGLQPKSKIPQLALKNTDGDETTLLDISKARGNAVFYFWTSEQRRHFKNVMKKVAKLQETHPNHSFVGINLRTSQDEWVKLLEEYQIDATDQYWSPDFEKVQRTLIVDGLNKCIITQDTLIVNAFANLYSSFEEKQDMATSLATK